MTGRALGRHPPTQPLRVVRIYRSPDPWESEAIVLSFLRILDCPTRRPAIGRNCAPGLTRGPLAK